MATTTIKDVARVAGVSVATVSRVLNGLANVSAPTRERVLEVVAQLRFVPSSTARSMVSRRTNTIGALLPDLHGGYFSELIRGIDLAARARGLHLLVSSSHNDVLEAGAALRAMNGRVDGLLVMSPHASPDFMRGNVADDLPAVLIATRAADSRHPSLDIDNRGGAFAMVRHFAERGHRRIGFIAGPADNVEAQERLHGYRAALAELGLLPASTELEWQGDFSPASGVRAGHAIAALAAEGRLPDAVFAANDLMAVGCLSALAEHGLRVPHDVALAGFDGLPSSRYANPPLTTVRAPIAELGRRALERLVGAIADPAGTAAMHQTLGVDIVARESSAVPASRGLKAPLFFHPLSSPAPVPEA